MSIQLQIPDEKPPKPPRRPTHALQVHSSQASGPFRSSNPTNVFFRLSTTSADGWRGLANKEDLSDASTLGSTEHVAPPNLALIWRSRDNRKGRNSIAVSIEEPVSDGVHQYRPRLTSDIREVGKNILRMFTTFPYWDMSYGVAIAYTLGSITWVINGCFAWLPIAFPNLTFDGEVYYGGGITCFIGVCLFQIGATLALLEAINDGCFHGAAMQRLLDGNDEEQKALVDAKIRKFFKHIAHTRIKPIDEAKARIVAVDPETSWAVKDSEKPARSHSWVSLKDLLPRRGAMDLGQEDIESTTYMTFRWLPTWHALTNHHAHDIGFWACLIQFIGSCIFMLSGTVELPGIVNHLNQVELNALYWIPQIVASAFFVTASALFTLETQEKWYKPQPGVLGWWIGAWALLGSIGFETCGSLGPAYGNSGAVYQMGLTSLWGSCCFLISSVIQWYEALNKHPVEELLNEPGHMKSFQIHPV